MRQARKWQFGWRLWEKDKKCSGSSRCAGGEHHYRLQPGKLGALELGHPGEEEKAFRNSSTGLWFENWYLSLLENLKCVCLQWWEEEIWNLHLWRQERKAWNLCASQRWELNLLKTGIWISEEERGKLLENLNLCLPEMGKGNTILEMWSFV